MNLWEKAITFLGFGSEESYSNQDNFIRNTVTIPTDQVMSTGTQGVLGLAAAWACTNLLAGTTASLPLMVYRTDREGRRTVYGKHPLFRVLHDSPNSDQTSSDYWEFVTQCIELQGNAYSEIDRGADGRVIALDTPISPDAMTVRRLSNGQLEYDFYVGGRRRVLPQERILHIRGPGGDPLGGMSALKVGRQVFGVANAVERAASASFANGVQSGGIFKSLRATPLTPEQMKAAQDIVAEKYAGAINAGRPMVLNTDMDFVKLSINPDDAQMLESRAFSIEQICMMFSVPPFMIGHTEKSTSWGTGIEQQTIGFVQFTLRRRLKRIEQALEKQLLTAADRSAGVRIEFNLEGLLRGDSKTRAEFYESGLKNKWRTINEVRSLENLEPVEWGNRPWGQMQDVQLDESGNLPSPQAQVSAVTNDSDAGSPEETNE